MEPRGGEKLADPCLTRSIPDSEQVVGRQSPEKKVEELAFVAKNGIHGCPASPYATVPEIQTITAKVQRFAPQAEFCCPLA